MEYIAPQRLMEYIASQRLLIAGASSGGEEEHLKSVLVIYLLFIIIYVRVRVCALVQARKN